MYVEAETGLFVFFFKKSGADLGCAARSVPVWHMLYVHPVANFIPEARLQSMVPSSERLCTAAKQGTGSLLILQIKNTL